MGDDGFKVDSAFVRGASTELIDALLVAREIAQKQQPLRDQLISLQKYYSSPFQAGEIVRRSAEAMGALVNLGESIAIALELAARQYEEAERAAEASFFTPGGAASIHAGDDMSTTD
ncbi:hypothetical protein [Embleya sp. NBC_00896]|uniref:hypothetical protein n=1 Tax=Embleya sp. NBC_00896 TaxID=2975961 RepID=UPI00386CDF83|nr:hypothetical protein OG928_14350 [Embleya sp. NBC_00896]